MPVGGTLVDRWWNDVARFDITNNELYLEVVVAIFDDVSAD